MAAVDAVLFDLYDTLVWSDWPRHAAFIASHLEVTPAAVESAYDSLRQDRDGGRHRDVETVLAAVAEACHVTPSPGQMQDLAEREAEFLAGTVQLYDDSLPVLRRLGAAEIKTGIVSNCSPSTRPVVDRLRLGEETGVVVLSCEVGEAKPSPGIYRAALTALGVAAERAAFVDDRTDYLDGAAGLGMTTFRIARVHAFGEAVTDGPHPVVTDMVELERALEGRSP